MISVKIPLMTKIGEPDVNGRVITKEAFQKCIESDFYREMILNGQLRLVYGGTAREFLDKEHYCIDPIKMHEYIFGHISQITEENVMAHIYRHEEIFLRQLDNGFKVYLTCIGKLDHINENIDVVRDIKIMYCSMGPDIKIKKQHLYLFEYVDETGDRKSFMVGSCMDEAAEKFAEAHRHHVIGNVSATLIDEVDGYNIIATKK